MKRKCKKIDITNCEYIFECITDWYEHRTKRQREKKEVRELLDKYSFKELAKILHSEIVNRKLNVKPVRIVSIIDNSNGKPRDLTIEEPKRQIYNYIASNALTELQTRCGFYQINMRSHGSPLTACKVVKGWMNDKNIKFVAQLDIRKCYPSITRENMMKWLRNHIKNDTLLWLIDELLKATECLSIGSFLSIRLCGLYLSDAYHYIDSHFDTFRRNKKVKTIKHKLFFLDDIFLFGSNARQLSKAVKDIICYFETIGLHIKSDWKMICLKQNRKNTHIDILGYKTYHNRVTMRRRDYLKTKKSLRSFKKQPNFKNAQGYISHYGLFLKHTNSVKFRKKYNADKYYSLARKVVSEHDRTCNVLRTTA